MLTRIVEIYTANRAYKVGGHVLDREINHISIETISFEGNPYSHYQIYSKDGELLASINCLIPCEVIYA